ncbi:MAG: peptidase S58 family protein [Limnohabitans sp.]|nr:peptidase S58 family protein [Limnohabitans sp.]
MHDTRLSFTDVAGISVGHHTDPAALTGCSVVLTPDGAVAGVDVRGCAPGTRETDCLRPGNLVQQAHAIVLSGGSAFGLDAAGGVMRWLEERQHGFQVGAVHVPIVPSAVIFDLAVGNPRIRPSADNGYQACESASNTHMAHGNIGAGTGATVGKVFGFANGMRGGIGSAALRVHGVTVGALIVCNALGDVIDPDNGQVIAGARKHAGSHELINIHQAHLNGTNSASLTAGQHTTIGVIATDAALTPLQTTRLAQIGHDGLARTIHPVHTPFDGDTLFALSTGKNGQSLDTMLMHSLVTEVVMQAVLCAVRAAVSVTSNGQWIPSAGELAAIRSSRLKPL